MDLNPTKVCGGNFFKLSSRMFDPPKWIYLQPFRKNDITLIKDIDLIKNVYARKI